MTLTDILVLAIADQHPVSIVEALAGAVGKYSFERSYKCGVGRYTPEISDDAISALRDLQLSLLQAAKTFDLWEHKQIEARSNKE